MCAGVMLAAHRDSHSSSRIVSGGGCNMMFVPLINFGDTSSSSSSGGGRAAALPAMCGADEGEMYLIHTYQQMLRVTIDVRHLMPRLQSCC